MWGDVLETKSLNLLLYTPKGPSNVCRKKEDTGFYSDQRIL